MNKTSKALGKEAKRYTVRKRATTRMQENCQQLTEIHRCQMATLIGNPIGNQIYDSRANKYAEIDLRTSANRFPPSGSNRWPSPTDPLATEAVAVPSNKNIRPPGPWVRLALAGTHTAEELVSPVDHLLEHPCLGILEIQMG